MLNQTFSLTVTSQIRNGALWKARKQFGSTKAFAEYLGISPGILYTWINLRQIPDWQAVKNKVLFDKIEERLLLLGITLEQAFPPELRTQEFLDKPKQLEQTGEVPMEALLSMPREALLLSAHQDQEIEQKELASALSEAVDTLTPQQKKVITLRFGLEGNIAHTLEEIGDLLGLNKSWIGVIERKALWKLRQLNHGNKTLEPFIDPDYLEKKRIREHKNEMHRLNDDKRKVILAQNKKLRLFVDLLETKAKSILFSLKNKLLQFNYIRYAKEFDLIEILMVKAREMLENLKIRLKLFPSIKVVAKILRGTLSITDTLILKDAALFSVEEVLTKYPIDSEYLKLLIHTTNLEFHRICRVFESHNLGIKFTECIIHM